MVDDLFEFQFPNGLRGDPVVYLPIKRFGEAVLFDLGSLEALSHRDILRVSCVFVSHTHMDHFIGFDRLLRVHLPHGRLLRMWGPAPFIDKVQAKLRSYTWNLIRPDQIRIHVSELHPDGHIEEALLTNTDQFAISSRMSDSTTGKIYEWPDGSFVRAVILDHRGTPSVSYQLQMPGKQKVLIEKLTAAGFEPGKWLGQLQYKLRNNQLEDLLFINEKPYFVSELSKVFIEIGQQRSLVYLTDVSFDAMNIEKIKNSFEVCEQLISESSFLDQDVKRAVDKAHLTSCHAAFFARILNAEKLHIFHISAIYGDATTAVSIEAQNYFNEFRGLIDSDLANHIDTELDRLKAVHIQSQK